MFRTTAIEKGPPPARTGEVPYDDRALLRLRHRDLQGLHVLMDDYQALADELEVIGGRPSDSLPPSRRAA